MSFLLTCPHCGPREVTDFGYGGETSSRPEGAPSWRELNAFNYFRKNVAGRQREWWYHRSGCRAWFVAERDTVTNEVFSTTLPDATTEERAASPLAGTGGAQAGRGVQ